MLPHKLGRVGVEPLHQIQADKHNARLHDVAFTSAEHNEPVVKKGAVPYMPDLAVEVQSPSDTPREMREKADYYLRNGARLVWLVYPPSQSVEVRTMQSDGILQIASVDTDGTLDGGEVLVGFTLPVREIFTQVSE